MYIFSHPGLLLSYQVKRNKSEEESHLEPEIDGETPLTPDTTEDIQLNTPDPLKPIDQQISDELSTFKDSGIGRCAQF